MPCRWAVGPDRRPHGAVDEFLIFSLIDLILMMASMDAVLAVIAVGLALGAQKQEYEVRALLVLLLLLLSLTWGRLNRRGISGAGRGPQDPRSALTQIARLTSLSTSLLSMFRQTTVPFWRGAC